MKAIRVLEQMLLPGIGLLLTVSTGGLAKHADANDPAAGNDNPRPSLDCYVDRTLNAPAPFHLFWKPKA